MSTQSLLLEVNNLTVDFKTENENVRAVDDISFSLKKGEVLGIVGESGSGKSVTALSIMQLIQTPPGKIISGDINYYDPSGNKIDLSLLSKKNIQSFRGKKIAMIFQEPMTSLNPVYTCGNQIVEAIRQHQNISKKKAKEKTIEL
ncbi:MAG: ABC transporter ATP-binding protein, partial [Bacteroidetes bacterium]|nr:ABC transporter ATP-binding protein [Bacteroidota bacterium]